jgi:hypothetical protein
MRNTTNQCTYRYVNLLYILHVGGLVVYNKLMYVPACELVACIFHNES